MPTFFQRPENALKRANEFIDVGKKQRALDALYDVIKSKKHRTWQKIHEPIMEKYLELCVELKKSHVAKEGLYQYKNICQQVNIKSLEDVVRRYLTLAEEKTEEARKESHQAVIDVDDLDVIQQPETLLLGGVSGEDTQDRTDRAILTPWVKFLWESYRQCLDLLRNNSSVEKLYQDIAQQAFKFCLKYARKTEFRKLCDNLRTHLGHIYKHQHQQRAINLNNPESQAMHLETRLVQLDSAIQMELWQEAFKAVEDIHGLIALSKKPPKPSLMANYYQKLGLVFWKSGSHMFHACAWHRLFHLSREQRKNLTQEELQKLASHVMCATVAIPIPASRNQTNRVLDMDEATLEKQRRLATLLGLNNPPTRASLIRDLSRYNIVQYVHPEMGNLYRWLEVEFHPLKLSRRVQTSLEYIKTRDELSQYIPAIQDITVTRLLKQVSQVYQTIEFSRLAALAPFATDFYLERVVVDSARKLDLQVRIDHGTKSLSFGTDLAVAQKEDVPEGPYLQSMPSENIRNQLTHLSSALEKAINIIQPREINSKREEIRAQIVNRYRLTAKKDHENILMRRQIIEERKEEIENLNVKREREEVEQAENQRQARHQAEMERLEREAQERARQRRLEEHKEIQIKAAKEKLEQLRSTELGAKVFKDMDEENLAELDPDEIVARQVSQLEKEKKEMQEKLRQQEKKIDFLERAKRTEEIPLLIKQAEDDSEAERKFWEQQEHERISKLEADRELALEHRDRLRRMMRDKEAFVQELTAARMSVYKEKLVAFEKHLSEERKRRLADRKERRKMERRDKWIKHREEEEQRRIDEELIRQREEEEREERERREEEEREYTERLRKLEEIAEKQRQREAEIEERLRKSREESTKDRFKEKEDTWRRRGDDLGRDSGRDIGGWRRGGDRDDERREPERVRDGEDSGAGKAWRPAGGGWREREKAREDSWTKKPDGDQDEDRDGREDRRGGGWRDREERAPARDRDERGLRDRDERAPPRDDRDTWRRGGDRDEERRAPREDRFGGDRGGDSAWRRGGDRDRDDDRRAAPRDDGDVWRRPPPRDSDRREDRGEEGGAWRRGGGREERAPPPSRDRDMGTRDGDDRPSWRERSAAMQRDVRLDDPGGPAWRRGGAEREKEMPREREPPRREEPEIGGGAWRRGGTAERDREPSRRVEREEPESGGNVWRRGGESTRREEPETGGGAWRRGGGLRDDTPRDEAPHDEAPRPSWRERQAAMSRDARLDDPNWQKANAERRAAQAAAKESEEAEESARRRPEPEYESEDPGWTTVRR